jgi:hypothetical protein
MLPFFIIPHARTDATRMSKFCRVIVSKHNIFSPNTEKQTMECVAMMVLLVACSWTGGCRPKDCATMMLMTPTELTKLSAGRCFS